MAKINLKPLSLAELKSLQLRVEKAIERQDKKQRENAIAILRAKAKELGISLSDLGTVKPAKKAAPKKATKPAKAAYRNTDDASQTWAGRGARPAWLKAALSAGKTLDDFKI